MKEKVDKVTESVDRIKKELQNIKDTLPGIDYLEIGFRDNEERLSIGGNRSTLHSGSASAHTVLFHWFHNIANPSNQIVRDLSKNPNYCYCEVCKYENH